MKWNIDGTIVSPVDGPERLTFNTASEDDAERLRQTLEENERIRERCFTAETLLEHRRGVRRDFAELLGVSEDCNDTVVEEALERLKGLMAENAELKALSAELIATNAGLKNQIDERSNNER